MAKKDLISKEIIKELLKDISKYFLNLDIGDNIVFLDKELQRIEKREADIVAIVDDEFVIHLEIQNSNDKTMANRMLRYYTDILRITDLPIKQYLIYIGKDKPKFQLEINRDLINYKYNFVDIKNIDCEVLLNQNSPEALVLAILCDFKDKKPKDVIKYIIDKLKDYTDENINQYRKYIMMLETLSTNRNLLKDVKEMEMLRTTTYQDLPSWHIGYEQGIEQGIEQGKSKAIKVLAELGLDIDTISKKLEISKDDVLKILQGEKK